MDNWSWERVLCSDPEMLIRQVRFFLWSEAPTYLPYTFVNGMLRHRFEVFSFVVISPYGQIWCSFYLLTCTTAPACQPETAGLGLAIRVW